MSDQVIIGRFPQESTAYQVMSDVKQVSAVRSAAVVARDTNGALQVPEFVGPQGDASGFFTGSIIGGLVGVLGGPLGVLLGWSAGALLGSSFDATDAVSEAIDEQDGISVLAQGITPGTNVLIVEVADSGVSAVDNLIEAQQGEYVHIPAEEVDEEVQNARAAAAEAAKSARQERRKERRHDFESKVKGIFKRDN